VAYETLGGRQYGESYLPESLVEPILLEGRLGGSDGASAPRVFRGFLLTSSSVAAVSIDGGPPIPTVPAVESPLELRSVLYEIPGVGPSQFDRTFRVKVTPLDVNGHQVVSLPPPQRTPSPAPVLETRTWTFPAPAARGLCQMTPNRLNGLTEQSGSVVSILRPATGLLGRPFMSCANTEWRRGELSLESFMLLDAEHPGTTPATISGLAPVDGRSAVFQSRLAGESVAARRVPGAWLVVKGGPNLRERLVLLTHLRASVHVQAKAVLRHASRKRRP
jgi:hypothetical protein